MTQPAMGNFTTEAGVYTVAPFQDENRPFDIQMLGIKPTGRSTGCYQGWLPSYAMWNSRLILAELWLLADRRALPDICGIYPEDPRGHGSCTYHGLRLPLGFTGDLEVTTDTGLMAWRGDWGGMKIRYTLSFRGGLLHRAENTSYNINTALNHTCCPPRDQPIDHLPLPDSTTPFDEYVIPLTDYEKQCIADEAEREARRKAKKEGAP